MDVKALVLEEYEDDLTKALEFSGFEKVEETEFMKALDELVLEEVYNAMDKSEYIPNFRFFFINEIARTVLAEQNSWEVINGFVYKEINNGI